MSASVEPWEPMSPGEVADALGRCDCPWWIAGGYAIDAFVGAFDRRPHGDVDVGLLARDQHVVRACFAGWDAWCADPPGALRPWGEDETLTEPVHDVWLRPGRRDPWRIALVLNSHVGDIWVYRRDERVRRPLGELVWWLDGIPYLVPEVQLLFKAKTVRAQDEQDFADAVPLLDDAQRHWLRRALEVAHPGHDWLSRT